MKGLMQVISITAGQLFWARNGFAGYMIVAILLPVLIAAALIHLLEKKSIVQQLREID